MLSALKSRSTDMRLKSWRKGLQSTARALAIYCRECRDRGDYAGLPPSDAH